VDVQTIAPETWFEAYISSGFSPQAAESYIGMTNATLHGSFPCPTATRHGVVTLDTYLADSLKAFGK
jgi:hypothetical protein